MLLQRLLPRSIEDGFCFVSDIGVKGCKFDLMPAIETMQMNSKSEMDNDLGHALTDGTAVSNPKKGDFGCSLSHIQSCNTSERYAPNFVYQRRRHLNYPNPISPADFPAKTSPENINFVYERRKHQRSGLTNFVSVVSANASLNGTCSSSIRSENPKTASLEKARGVHESDTAKYPPLTAPADNKEMCFTTFEANNGCPSDHPSSNSKDKKNKTVELYSVDDSCSSSMLNLEGGVAPSNMEIDDTDECSSSGAHVTDVVMEDLPVSVKALCISILKNHNLLNLSGLDDENNPSCSSSSNRSCNVCGLIETALEMLICDECEEAFHLSCFNPCIKKIPIDDWYCQSCAKKKHNLVKERAVTKSSIIGSGKSSVTSEGHLSPIELMLKDTQPYVTSVRVGKGFQALIPEWRGPTTKDLDLTPEPPKLDPLFGVNSSRLTCGRPPKSSFIGNWLQCRDVIIGIGGEVDGTICGKWRRAPLFEPQTDKWDCFCSVLWDPTYADCSVPQELDTEEVLKQLKYIEILRPRLTAKRRKLDLCSVSGANGCQAAIADASVETV